VSSRTEQELQAELGPDFVQSLARGLRVIEALGGEQGAATLSGVAQRTGLARAAARRFLRTLEAMGYVAAEGKEFRLQPRVLDLGYAYLSSMPLWEVAEPAMEELVEQVHESCSAAVLDEMDIVYVARVPTKRIMAIAINVGTRLPAYCTSMGRVLLAGLPEGQREAYLKKLKARRLTEKTVTEPARLRELIAEVAKQKYALLDQELEDGVRSVAVPLLDRQGRTVAAINVSAHAARVTKKELVERILPRLQRAARQITLALQSRSPAQAAAAR
jgi:IclR family pca regulon transcriptional regulator